MAKIRVVLIVDHPLRDLPGLSLIAMALADRDCDVFLLPMFAQDRETFALKADFVLLNYLRKNNELFVKRLQDCHIQYGIQDTEGGFYGDLAYYGGLLSTQADLYEGLRCNLVWGQKMYDYLRAHNLFRRGLILTGLPRFDFYAPQFRELDFQYVPAALKTRPMALINTKVAVANPLFLTLDEEIAIYRYKLGISDEQINHFLVYGRLSIEDNLKLSKELAAALSEWNVVIRPHPHENDETYRQGVVGSLQNLSVYRQGPVIPWILSSTAVIHRHCTTAIEAALAGRPALAPTWVRTSANAPDAEAVSHEVHSWNELLDLLRAAEKGRLTPTPESLKTLQRIVDDWLYQVDGQSFVRTANAILESLSSHTRANVDRSRQALYSGFAHRTGLAPRLFHHVNQLGKMLPSALWQLDSLRLAKWKKSEKVFTHEDVKKWIGPVEQNLGSTPVRVEMAVESEDYIDGYPGLAVKVSKS